MYPPLTSGRFSPGVGADFWLLGIGFIEISAIAGAIELIVGILRTRAPGMSLGRMPIFAWVMLAMGGMVIFAFPPLILGTLLLELERAFGWPFFMAQHGGDPLLWQHLFWFFGHPDVYMIFLPAAGMVSMIVATMAQTPLVGYRWVVGGILGMAGLSFALWVHHMFAARLSVQAMHVFSAASMVIVIPSAIQVFAWLATLRRGRVRFATPMRFLLGFFVIFTIGGLTGVMLAVLPFDWQAHDTHFVVAHLHYVLIGGMLFPLFAGFYYWAPTACGRPLSDRLGRWVCGLLFTGVHVTFLPMHLTGLLGMPRRVYTYPAGLGLEWPNLVSSVGSLLIAAGIALFLVDVGRHLRVADKVDVKPVERGHAGVAPAGPLRRAQHPARGEPRAALGPREPSRRGGPRRALPAGHRHGPAGDTRDELGHGTSGIRRDPDRPGLVPGPRRDGHRRLFPPADRPVDGRRRRGRRPGTHHDPGMGLGHGPRPGAGPVEVARDVWLPTYVTGRSAHSWWAMIVVIGVLATTFASLVFSYAYAYLWMVGAEEWPPVAAERPARYWAAIAAGAWLGSSGLAVAASRALAAGATGRFRLRLGLGLSLVLLAIAVDGVSHWRAGLAPDRHAYEATVATFVGVQTVTAAAVLIMALYTLVRSWRGLRAATVPAQSRGFGILANRWPGQPVARQPQCRMAARVASQASEVAPRPAIRGRMCPRRDDYLGDDRHRMPQPPTRPGQRTAASSSAACSLESVLTPTGSRRTIAMSRQWITRMHSWRFRMPDVDEQQQSEDVRGDAGDMAADMVTIGRAGADSVAARDVVIRQGGVRSLSARDVIVRQGGVGRLEAQKVSVTQGGVALASTQTLEVTAGGVGGAITDSAALQQSWVQAVVAQESVTLDQAAAGLVASRTVRARDSAIGLVLAREFHGDGVRVLMAPRAALAFGAGLGLVLALVAGIRRQHRG